MHPGGDDHAVSISLPAHLRPGTYVVAWRVISADGHPVSGTVAFSIERASVEGGPRAQFESDLAVRSAVWVGNVVISVALLFGVGTAFFIA